jgi:hypothetical protein
MGFQLCLYLRPLQTVMAGYLFLKSGFQSSEQFFTLLRRQLILSAICMIHNLILSF